jgi:hypothetical protein
MTGTTDSAQRSTHSELDIDKNGDTTESPTTDLAQYYFSPDPFSSGFNWRSVALTLDAWNRLSSDHYAYVFNFGDTDHPDPQSLIIIYGAIELFIDQGDRDKVMWGKSQGALSGDPESPGIIIPTELPSDPVGLLRALNLTAHPLADDVIRLWKDLIAFLPTLDWTNEGE